MQNTVATGEYIRQVRENGLATARGIALSDEDRLRAWVIERLMCDFAVSTGELQARFGETAAAPVVQEMRYAALYDGDGLVSFDGRTFSINEIGRPFARTVAATFDAYLANGAGRHSVAV